MDRIDCKPKQCVACGNDFSIRDIEKPSAFVKRKYCSRKCLCRNLNVVYHTGKKAHNNLQTEVECIHCHTKRMEPPSLHRPFCNRKCMAAFYKEYNRGEVHWNWQGGITEQEARDVLYPGYKEWRKAVYRRDNWTCRLCGNKKSGTLNAHHIKTVKEYPDLILDVDNGLTVCKPCHKQIHYGN